jgi:hypothetical protein
MNSEEIIVYHGTTYTAACNIMITGFLTSYSKIAAYGIGTYASPDPLFALTYCKDTLSIEDYSFIFVCKFLKGTYGTKDSSNKINTLFDFKYFNIIIYVIILDIRCIYLSSIFKKCLLNFYL